MQAAVREIYVDSTVVGLHRPARQRHAEPSRRLPRRVAARLDRAVPRRPGAGRAARPRLRHPGRHQGARRARAGPPADHQDELVDPRRAGRPGRPRAARVDRDRRHPPDRRRSDRAARGRPRRRRRPRAPSRRSTERPRRAAAMIRKLELLVVAVVLVVAAFSTGLPFLFYLLYLAILVIGGSYVAGPPRPDRPRGGLRGQPAPRPRRRPDAGDLHAAQREPDPEAVARDPQPDDAARRPARAGRSRSAAGPSGRGSSGRRCRGAATSGSSRSTSGPATRSASSRRRRRSGRAISRRGLPAARAAARAGGCRPPHLEGSHASPVRTLQTTPLATSVRPYAPGDAMNRIHWKTTARHGEIQVKEFDLEQTADAWIILDLQRGDPDRPRRRVDGRGGDPRGGVDRGQGAPGEPRGRDDRQRRPDRVPAARPRRPPAPQDHAAPGRGRGRRQRPARRDAHRDASGGCAAG